MSTEFGPIFQHGYIVHDVAKSAAEWAERMGVGPFYVLDRIRQENYHYRGVRTPMDIRLAFGYWGTIQVELVQPLDDADTFYKDALRTGAGKLNHCATYVTDLDALLAKRKLQDRVVQNGSMPTGVKYVYLKEYLPGGLHLELIQSPEEGKQGFVAMEAIARRWDGKNPVRDIMNLGADAAALAKG